MPSQDNKVSQSQEALDRAFVDASELMDCEKCRDLLDQGANINAKDPDDIGAFHHVICNKNQEFCLELMARGIDIHEKTKNDRGSLHYAAQHDLPLLCLALIEAGMDINEKSAFGWTPLHYAARYENPTVAILLLEHGADIHAVTRKNGDVFDIAKKRGNEDVLAIFNSWMVKKSALLAVSESGLAP